MSTDTVRKEIIKTSKDNTHQLWALSNFFAIRKTGSTECIHVGQAPYIKSKWNNHYANGAAYEVLDLK